MTTFYCMRHGLTDWNLEHRIQGSNTDRPLVKEGREQAAKWAESLADGDFDMIVTSDLKRAKETAAIINEKLNLPISHDVRLNEQDWGEWSGMTRGEIKDLGKLYRQQERKGLDFRPAKGESRNEVLMRACDSLMDLSEEHPGKSILIVAHEGIVLILAYALSGLDYMPDDPNPVIPYRLHRYDCADLELAIGELNIEI